VSKTSKDKAWPESLKAWPLFQLADREEFAIRDIKGSLLGLWYLSHTSEPTVERFAVLESRLP
jgi:hypothetical protein